MCKFNVYILNVKMHYSLIQDYLSILYTWYLYFNLISYLKLYTLNFYILDLYNLYFSLNISKF